MIEVREVTKRFGAKTAVDGLSFTAQPGQVMGRCAAATSHFGGFERSLLA